MGYTHYFRQQRHATPDEWAAITRDFEELYLGDWLPLIQREDDNPDAPLISDAVIVFNGIGKDGHETMVLEPDATGFQFCKTARKPYDAAVVALLILAHHHAPGCWLIESDGTQEDWLDGLTLARQVCPEASTIRGIGK